MRRGTHRFTSAPRGYHRVGEEAGAPFMVVDDEEAAEGYVDRRGDVGPLLGSRSMKYDSIILFAIATELAVLLALALLLIFGASSHHGMIIKLVERVETVENLARNVNSGSQAIRRAFGNRGLDEPEEDPSADGSLLRGKGMKEPLHRWLEERGPDEEALITDKAADSLARGIRTAIRIAKQVEKSELIPTAARVFAGAEAILAGPDAQHIIHALSSTVQDPQAVGVYHQSLTLMAQVQAMALPLIDALSSEVRQQLGALQASGAELGAARFQEMIREIGDVSHKVGTGLRDLVVWYREGGPSDAAILMGDMVRTARELIESPAADSLVHVLEGIDWKTTGHQLADVSHHAAEILRTVNEAGTVDAGDHLVRAVAAILESPGTQRVVDLLPGIASDATALLERPNTQELITQSSLLMTRLEGVLGKAEASRAVERSAEFLGTFRALLGALIDGGLHMELGQLEHDYPSPLSTPPPLPSDGDSVKDPAHFGRSPDLLRPLHVTNVEPEKTRLRNARPHPEAHRRRGTQ